MGIMSSPFSEDSLVEQPAIALFAELGWETVNCYDEYLGRDAPPGRLYYLGRETSNEVILLSRLLPALGRLNPQLPAEAFQLAIQELIRERSLVAVHLWDEVKDRLHVSALELTEEQQQRLCIARVLAVEPEILLMDEPCSALDPLATLRIEELMQELKKTYTIIIVTHNMQQAARVSDDTGFMLLGELIEFGPTKKIFTHPGDRRTEDYITGKYG